MLKPYLVTVAYPDGRRVRIAALADSSAGACINVLDGLNNPRVGIGAAPVGRHDVQVA
ncbi:hypothetical protein [Paludibacterium yongneupense]|uniref:hypothetical protein n=1 Tax=Paludibacterium yongneupense TaxID=400061 RepID=UPI0003F7DC01|nr:hypothetical protein [Paludibacterium yongneupense]